jgi:hypothetical protein
MSQIVNKLQKMDFLTYYYADLMYHGYYSNFIWVQAYILSEFTVA